MRTLCFVLLLMPSLAAYSQSPGQTTQAPNYDSLRVVLETMLDKDQGIRRILVDSIGIDSPDAGPYLKQMMDIDMENQRNMKIILGKYGWIGQSKIGKKAAEALFFVVQHSDVVLMEKWYPELKRLADMGEADKIRCAMMEDRLLMWNGKKQIYGTQAAEFREDKKLAIWPIENPKTVNERRRKVGMDLTIEENAARMNAVYDEDEPLPIKRNQ